MKIRRLSIGFAIFSAVYWQLFNGVAQIVNGFRGPFWQVQLAYTVPAILYAILCLFVFRRVARRAYLAAKQTGDN
ncbi:hypothetical protein JW805_04960 [Roseomonas aeriglobus]|nr:hypothetical protein [Roseomonas aeriglobus]